MSYSLVGRLLLNPIFLDCQSNPNPSQIYDWQSKSKSNFQNGLTIQSKSNHNPTIFGKRYRTANIEWSSFMMKPWNSQETFLIKFQPYCKIICLKILMNSSLASLLEHDALWNFNLLIKLFWWIGFGLKWQNWIDNPNPKSNFDFGLSITIQSTKLDCNPDWAIQQSNPAIPCSSTTVDILKSYFQLFYNISDLWATTTFQQQPILLGPKCVKQIIKNWTWNNNFISSIKPNIRNT